MTRRRPEERRRTGRRAPRREEEEAAPLPHYDADTERRLTEEVLYLHSLWRQGPPAPAPAPTPAPGPGPGGGTLATVARAGQRKRRRIESRAEPEGPDWAALAPSPPAPTSPAHWPHASSSSPAPRPPPQEPSPASLAQRAALRAAEEFFSGHGPDGDGDEEEGSESEDGEDTAAGFFLGLFEQDAALRGYYERSHEDGEFLCMGCVGRKVKRGRARRFKDCVSLVQHARAATRVGRPRAHRALAAAVCRVLGWDIERLPSIVIDPRGTLGQALLAREAESAAAAATAHQAKENVDAGKNGHTDAAKEDVALGKKGSSNDDKVKNGVQSCRAFIEDVDSRMNDAPSSDGDAAKEDVDAGKIGTPSNDNDGEIHKQENGTGTSEKGDTNDINPLNSKDTNDIDPLNSQDTTKELCKAAQEEGAIDNKQQHAKSADDMGATCNIRLDDNSSKEEGAIDNKQEHAKSADDMGGTCNVRLENNSSKEEAATENKEEHTGIVDTKDADIGNLGNNFMFSSKS